MWSKLLMFSKWFVVADILCRHWNWSSNPRPPLSGYRRFQINFFILYCLARPNTRQSVAVRGLQLDTGVNSKLKMDPGFQNIWTKHIPTGRGCQGPFENFRQAIWLIFTHPTPSSSVWHGRYIYRRDSPLVYSWVVIVGPWLPLIGQVVEQLGYLSR